MIPKSMILLKQCFGTLPSDQQLRCDHGVVIVRKNESEYLEG